MSENGEQKVEKRVHDTAPSQSLADFMKSGWLETPLGGITPDGVITYCFQRRKALSAAFPGIRIVLPSGNFRVRSNDCDFRYRPHSAFAYYSGVQGIEATADAVLVLEPVGESHETTLYIHPRSTRETDAFYRDARYGELWVGRRFTLDEARERYQVPTRAINDLEAIMRDGKESLTLRDQDVMVDHALPTHPREKELEIFVSTARMIKDEYEILELQSAVDSTFRGFNDVISSLPAAVSTPRGERVLESAFFGRARIEGNDLGYDTISASGSHACVLHWTRNDGEVHPGDLVLIDAGVEMDSFYTADITRTLPVNGKFSPAQRSLYMLVYEAQLAGIAAVKPGATFKSINDASQAVLAKGLQDMGVLPISAEESLQPEMGHHRRWTLHGVSHMLGMDVHDCAKAREEDYNKGILKEGMVLTVEPGLYIQPDDELFAPEYRGIGIRIEDDVLVTADGCRNLSDAIPRHPDEIERWIASLIS